jgi:hypothetical protein
MPSVRPTAMPLTDKYFFSYLIFFNLTFLCKFKVQRYGFS